MGNSGTRIPLILTNYNYIKRKNLHIDIIYFLLNIKSVKSMTKSNL